mmetsp:Transcript_9442/g.28420  ORF Transcript_9442/g.28420 Transcript_9442/m.28420 type:complete len:269 (-) Transcript_9442:700-1506(-)
MVWLGAWAVRPCGPSPWPPATAWAPSVAWVPCPLLPGPTSARYQGSLARPMRALAAATPGRSRPPAALWCRPATGAPPPAPGPTPPPSPSAPPPSTTPWRSTPWVACRLEAMAPSPPAAPPWAATPSPPARPRCRTRGPPAAWSSTSGPTGWWAAATAAATSRRCPAGASSTPGATPKPLAWCLFRAWVGRVWARGRLRRRPRRPTWPASPSPPAAGRAVRGPAERAACSAAAATTAAPRASWPPSSPWAACDAVDHSLCKTSGAAAF